MSKHFASLFFVVGGVFFAYSSLLPESWSGLIFSCLFAFFFTAGVAKKQHTFLAGWLGGVVFSVIAFYWLPDTLSYFGGFGYLTSLIFFLVYCLVSGLQFGISAWLARKLEEASILTSWYLAVPTAWVALEVLFPRLFPWAVGHTVIRWYTIAGLAEFGGVFPLSGLILWWGGAAFKLVEAFYQRSTFSKRGIVSVGAITLFALICGWLRLEALETQMLQLKDFPVGLVQGNLEAKEKADIKQWMVNIQRYQELTKDAVEQGAKLIIWPESVVNLWYPEDIKELKKTVYDPLPTVDVPLIFGTLAYRRDSGSRDGSAEYLRFNSAAAVSEDKQLSGLYHKQILMPFGEYLPFSDKLPFLRKLSPYSGDFTPGDRKTPLALTVIDKEKDSLREVYAGILICYEDLVPAISRESVILGANLLINLTNDAWYGDTAAPFQHHLLALWRAIENRRYLLRVTNTGYTAVVDPFGRTIASLPLFAEGVLLPEVKLLSGRTFYAQVGDLPLYVILFLIAVLHLRFWSRSRMG